MAKQSSTKAKAKRAAIAAPMTGKQYQAALAELGISNYAFAPLVGIALRTAQHYAGDETRIPGPVAALVRLLVKHPRLKAELFPPAG